MMNLNSLYILTITFYNFTILPVKFRQSNFIIYCWSAIFIVYRKFMIIMQWCGMGKKEGIENKSILENMKLPKMNELMIL